MARSSDLLGLAEVADLFGTSRQNVTNWRNRRPGFPEPVADLRSGPIWDRSAIETWAAESNIELSGEFGDESAAKPKSSATTVALMNMKGGVGKSTLAANLGWYGTYYYNLKVLLVDLDPQFNLSQYVLGSTRYEEHVQAKKKTVLDIFEQATPRGINAEAARDLDPSEVIANVREWRDGSRLDLLPSSLELSFTLKNPSQKEGLLAHFLDEVKDRYDLILIDCAPTDSMLTSAAYLASDYVLIPVKPEFLSTIGLPLAVRSIEEFMRVQKGAIDVLGIVFNSATGKVEDQRSRAYVRKIAKEQDWKVFQHSVSYSDSYPKGSRYGTPIFLTDHARKTKIADFEAVGDEFFELLGYEA